MCQNQLLVPSQIWMTLDLFKKIKNKSSQKESIIHLWLRLVTSLNTELFVWLSPRMLGTAERCKSSGVHPLCAVAAFWGPSTKGTLMAYSAETFLTSSLFLLWEQLFWQTPPEVKALIKQRQEPSVDWAPRLLSRPLMNPQVCAGPESTESVCLPQWRRHRWRRKSVIINMPLLFPVVAI